MAGIVHAEEHVRGSPKSRVTFLIGAVNQAAPGIAAVAAGFANLTAIGMRTAAEMTAGMRAVEAGFMAVGAASALALGVATSEAMKFEKQMKMVQAVSNDMTNAQITQMSNQIKALSIKYGEAPAATAEAMQTLGRAGIKDASAQMAIFESAMKMAKIEGMDLQAALEGVVQTTSLFGSDMNNAAQFAKDAAKMTEYLVHASQISPTDVPDIMQGLTYVGGAAKEVGWSPTETMSAISYMAQKGVSGSIAGTSIRGLLTKSVGDQKKYQDAAARLGLDPGFAWRTVNGKEEALPLHEIVRTVRQAAASKGMGEREQFELWNAIGMQKTAQQMLKINPDELQAFDEEMEKSFDLQKKVDMAMSSAAVQFDRFTAAVRVLAINVGEKLLPIVGWLAGALANLAGWLAQSQVAVWGLTIVLSGGLILGAVVVFRWLWVAIKFTFGEVIKLTESLGGLRGVMSGNVSIGQLFASTQAKAAVATDVDTVATNANTIAHERNAMVRRTLLATPVSLGGKTTPIPTYMGPYGIPSLNKSGPIIPPVAPAGRLSRMGSGLKGAGSSLMSLMGGPVMAILGGALAAGLVASAVQDTKNVATHNAEAMKNSEALVEAYTSKEARLRREKTRLVNEQDKYNKSSEEWANIQRQIVAKDGEISYIEGKRSKAQQKIAENQEQITRWTENATEAYQNMLVAMDETPVPKPGVTAPTIPDTGEGPQVEGMTDISTRSQKTAFTVWNKFKGSTLDKRREWIETSNDPMARFYRSEEGSKWNQDIINKKQKENEIWLRTMGIDPKTGQAFEQGQYGSLDWIQDMGRLGISKLDTHATTINAGVRAQSFDLETGRKKGFWEQWFGVKPQQSVGQVDQTTNKVNGLFKNSNSEMLSGWSKALSGMNQKTGLFNQTTQTNMSGATGSVLSNVSTISTGLFGMQGSIAAAIGWFDLLWAAARGGVIGAATQVLNTAFQGSFKVGTAAALSTAAASGNQATVQKTQQQVNTPFFPVAGASSPVKIWNRGTPRAASGAIEFPDLNPDLFKKRAIETGKALGAGEKGGIHIENINVQANTKEDARYISEAIRKELQALVKAV